MYNVFNMINKNILAVLVVLIATGVAGYFLYFGMFLTKSEPVNLDPTPQNVTLSGTYVCLPHLNASGPQTTECAFGIKTDDGVYYAVNFGQSANAMTQFQSGAHITADGFVVIKEALNTDQWQKYNMKGIFTITKMIAPAPIEGKLNINVICESALSYMTFPNSKAADAFVAECKQGNHPEVIEQYRKQMNLGEGVAI